MSSIKRDGNRVIIRKGTETLWLEPWGEGIRVRAAHLPQMPDTDWALLPASELPAGASSQCICKIIAAEKGQPSADGVQPDGESGRTVVGEEVVLTNGKITACVNHEGWLSFYNAQEQPLLEEYYRNRDNMSRYCVPLNIRARELKPVQGRSDYMLTARFEACPDEHIWGMGQYQDGLVNKKGACLELAHRNTQASIPFYVSSRGYGFLWNNPAVGRVMFAENITEWHASCTDKLDYWIVAGDTPGEILRRYADVTGKVPMMPEYGMGFWQCKLRYRTQEELLRVARGYKERGLPLDVIVVDFFHWTLQGDWKFDPLCWPDPEAMVKELKEMGTELMVSVWPTVDHRSENFRPMDERGLLLKFDRGININMSWMGDTVFFDATHPEAREYVWGKVKDNYFDKGIKIFWLDEAEPEGIYDFDLYRYHIGPAQKVTCIYPNMYAKGFYDGMRKAGIENPLNLVRCGWAGIQRYGALLWSGDIESSFRSLREQLAAGLSAAMAGVPWWTSDIGGFIGGYTAKPEFRELLVRWFQFGCFCPVFRLHGDRLPFYPPQQEYIGGVRQFGSGEENEIWSFGGENEQILRRYILMREKMRPYIREQMKTAHEHGDPVIRPVFYDFPDDRSCLGVYNQFMFGPDVLVAPVMEEGVRERSVYLPGGTRWLDTYSGKTFEGGSTYTAAAPIDIIPVFIREGAKVTL